jgi:hypothetical protein
VRAAVTFAPTPTLLTPIQSLDVPSMDDDCFGLDRGRDPLADQGRVVFGGESPPQALPVGYVLVPASGYVVLPRPVLAPSRGARGAPTSVERPPRP